MKRTLLLLALPLFVAADVPRAADPRLVVTPFASAPDIVHPVGIAFDQRGRLLVIESHTHFPPKDYKGPRHDRIRIVEDTDGDGKADRFTTFFEGTRATMDIAVHPVSGDVYLATRNEVLRLRDTRGTGKADVRERLAFLETKGDYPHNGLSGLCFDSRGDLYFGMGENLGASYSIVGADGTTLRGEGEGGNIFWCRQDGSKLRRVATGFWNPFGICRDIRGRLFSVDNDPDSMPPCRMLHVVEGADFGYQFRYGRSGRHPFQCWDGQLPGTLPMVSGTGESPCEVLSYESDGLPREYLGNLLVAAWSDHRIERYRPKERGASFTATREPFVQGGANFRPVGLAVAPDGSLFVSDWVNRDYQLHGQGALWHVRAKSIVQPRHVREPDKALHSLHWQAREEAARQLARTASGRALLRRQLRDPNLRLRAACLTALIDQNDPETDLASFARAESDGGLRALAVRGLVSQGKDAREFLVPGQPAEVRFAAVAGLRGGENSSRLRALLGDADPFLRHAAIHRLATNPEALERLGKERSRDPRERRGLLLALRASGRPDARTHLPQYLADPDEEVRLLAVKWIADEQVTAYRDLVEKALASPALDVRMLSALATALARLDRRPVDESRMADYFAARVLDESASLDLRRQALRLVPARHAKLTLGVLTTLLQSKDGELQREAVQALVEHPNPKRTALLVRTARDERRPQDVRAFAILALSEQAGEYLDDLLPLVQGSHPGLRDEALRALTGVRLSPDRQSSLRELARRQPGTAPLVARVLGEPVSRDRPAAKEVEAWSKRLEGPADEQAGRRIFFHPRLGGCFRCHRVDGRGQDVGPDLSTIGRREKRFLLESILQPSNEVAPHFQTWSITTEDGRTRTGMLTHTYLDEYTYVDEKGKPFKVRTQDVAEVRALPRSLMPEGMVDTMTDQELRDLLAFLASRR